MLIYNGIKAADEWFSKTDLSLTNIKLKIFANIHESLIFVGNMQNGHNKVKWKT